MQKRPRRKTTVADRAAAKQIIYNSELCQSGEQFTSADCRPMFGHYTVNGVVQVDENGDPIFERSKESVAHLLKAMVEEGMLSKRSIRRPKATFTVYTKKARSPLCMRWGRQYTNAELGITQLASGVLV